MSTTATKDWEITDDDFISIEIEDSDDIAELADLADGFKGYEEFDFQWYAQQVADRIFNIHMKRGVDACFVFSLTCNSNGEIDGAEVYCSIPGRMQNISRSLEWKRMTDDREAVGTAGLLAIKNALMYEYASCRSLAEEVGLI